MKYLYIILFFSWVHSYSQASFFQKLSRTASVYGLTDSAVQAYSLRRIVSTYQGPAITVRRSSDNTTANIGFINNNLDTITLKAFVGSGNGYISIWWNQYKYYQYVVQPTTSNQPLIVNGGVVYRLNGQPAIYFNGASYLYGNCYPYFPTGNATYITVSYCNNSTLATNSYNGIFVYGASGTGNTVFLMYGTDGHVGTNAISVSQYGDGFGKDTSLQKQNLQFVIKPAATGTWYQWVNNIYASSKSMTTNTTLYSSTNSFTIGSFNGPVGIGSYLNGYIQEIVICKGDLSSIRSSIQSNINSYYSIY